MDLRGLYAGSFIDWEAVAASWNKRTVPSRLLLFAARRYLEEGGIFSEPDRAEMLAQAPLPEEIKHAFASPPAPPCPASTYPTIRNICRYRASGSRESRRQRSSVFAKRASAWSAWRAR